MCIWEIGAAFTVIATSHNFMAHCHHGEVGFGSVARERSRADGAGAVATGDAGGAQGIAVLGEHASDCGSYHQVSAGVVHLNRHPAFPATSRQFYPFTIQVPYVHLGNRSSIHRDSHGISSCCSIVVSYS